MFLFDVAFFMVFVIFTFGIILIHRAHALHNIKRKGAVDGTYWGAYSHKPVAATASKNADHGPKVVNGKLVLPKIVAGASSAVVGKSSYAGRR